MPHVGLLSVLIPCFNEEATVATIVGRVIDAPLNLRKEITIVDDGSTDGSAEIARELESAYGGRPNDSIVTEFHRVNRGGDHRTRARWGTPFGRFRLAAVPGR